MKIELYLVPEDKEGILLKRFLERNKLPFKEIITDDINLLRKVMRGILINKISLLRIKYSHSIHVIVGFAPLELKQLIDHIKEYKPKIEENF